MLRPMDSVRFGLAIRALRRRRGWAQAELAQRARMSRSAVSRVERGQGDGLSVRALTRLGAALAARVSVRVLWQGEELDRLLDADHARLVEWVVARLSALGWIVVPEVTFHVGGERGSIDVLAWHPETGHLLIVEVKSVVPDVQATLAGVDRKARLAPTIARERGWHVTAVSRMLVLPDDRTARRRLEQFAATFDRAFPERTVALRRWMAAPDRAVAGVMFVTGATQVGARHRVRTSAARSERGSASRP
jgi:transcriptional regulator with XRE-family HTH domain